MRSKNILLANGLLILALTLSSITWQSPAMAQSGVKPRPKATTVTNTIPAGTAARVELQNALSSKISEVGDEVYAILETPIIINGTTMLRRGTQVLGHVTQVSAAKRPQRQASMTIVFDKVITIDGEQEIGLVIKAIDNFVDENKLKANDEGRVQGGHSGRRTVSNATTGAILGSIGSTGVYWGTGSVAATVAAPAGGAAAGILLSKGNDIRLLPGTVFRLEFTKPFIIPTNSPAADPGDPEPDPVDTGKKGPE